MLQNKQAQVLCSVNFVSPIGITIVICDESTDCDTIVFELSVVNLRVFADVVCNVWR